MGTTILLFEDRVVIETLHHEKHSLQNIADYLGFSKTTIFNEVHRLAGEYHAVKAQTDHEIKLSHIDVPLTGVARRSSLLFCVCLGHRVM